MRGIRGISGRNGLTEHQTDVLKDPAKEAFSCICWNVAHVMVRWVAPRPVRPTLSFAQTVVQMFDQGREQEIHDAAPAGQDLGLDGHARLQGHLAATVR